MKKKIAPRWVLMEILDLLSDGVNIYSWEDTCDYLQRQNRFTMLDWIRDYRQLYTYSVMSKQFEKVDFYYGREEW